MSEAQPPLDCLVIGAGPAGLIASVYLARFRRRSLTLDGGDSRASLIPLSHNMAGFPEGISGPDLLERLRRQAGRYGAEVRPGRVRSLEMLPGGGFQALLEDGAVRARTVLLATGVVDVEPELPDIVGAVRSGLLRHCPICDAFEVAGQRIAVIGSGTHALREALFLRHYSSEVTVLTLGQGFADGAPALLEALTGAGIGLVAEPLRRVRLVEGRIAALETLSGRSLIFDTLYSALGCSIRADLARTLGARFDEGGSLQVDAHQETSVRGLYAAGDVVGGLSQIAVAAGHAAIAATAIHNRS